MDNVTHLAIAGTLGYAMRQKPRQIGLMAAAAVIPDFGWIIGWFAPAVYLRFYHGPTHSILGAAALAAVLAFAAQKYAKVESPWLPAGIGIASHLFLDYFTGFGEQLFFPYAKRFGVIWVANYDMTTLAVIGILLIFPAVLNAVNREIGAKRVNSSRAAWVALGILVALLPLRGFWHSRAQDIAHGQPMTQDPEYVLAFPSAIMPWVSYVVEDTEIAYMVYEMNGWTGKNMPFVTRFPKLPKNNLLEGAQGSETAREFLSLATVPYYSIEDGRKATMVRIRDLAFYSPGGSNKPFSVEIEVKSTKQVVAERVNF